MKKKKRTSLEHFRLNSQAKDFNTDKNNRRLNSILHVCLDSSLSPFDIFLLSLIRMQKYRYGIVNRTIRVSHLTLD